jgi:alpha-ribazole phosphatase
MNTRIWLIRHALVAENARAVLYGTMDVALCPHGLAAHRQVYEVLAANLPRPASWLCTPLSRTRRTAEAIFAAGYPAQSLAEEPELIEQDLGAWQGLPHAQLPPLLAEPAHAFWPLAGSERPPGGESMQDVIARVGPALERIAADNRGGDAIIVSHGGAIRAAVAHALRIGADSALHLSVGTLSLTRLDREPEGWRVVCINDEVAI